MSLPPSIEDAMGNKVPAPPKAQSSFRFDITQKSSRSKARLGSLTTPHGTIETPAFIFCATKATLKSLPAHTLKDLGASIILANTYHLMLQPGSDLVVQMGGLHKFMSWDGPMLTDSGGFQVFSLGHGGVANEIKGRSRSVRPTNAVKITEDGVIFKSHTNGDTHLLTPERSIQIQHQLGADLILVFDECTPFHVDKAYTAAAMHRSHRWERRSQAEFRRITTGSQALYGIVQGGVYPDLRQESAGFVAEEDFFGQAVGGSLGGSKNQMADIVDLAMEYLPAVRPTHLLGIGGLKDIQHGIQAGIDTFDCVHPTRLARHGGALIDESYWNDAWENPHEREHIHLKKACFREDPRPIDENCPCPACKHYSRAYIHHLFKAGELLGLVLLTQHNVTFMARWMRRMRRDIQAGKL
jgi:queuine tRNA-ribosyltransferase